MAHPTRYTLWVSSQIEINTDPQRRCYNGCHAKSELVWTEWADLGHPVTYEDGMESIKLYEQINPGRRYLLSPPENKDPS